MERKKANPFVKWAGGKYRLSEIIISETEYYINLSEKQVYLDPFVGGGGMFFAMTNKFDFERKIISDINPHLINAYLRVKHNLQELINLLEQIEGQFNNLNSDEDKKEFYLDLRETFNVKIINNVLDIEQAAYFIALNKLGFNGLYRVNGKGLFNVPFGQKKTIKLFDEENLKNVSEVLQDTEILCQDYANVLKYVNNEALVYFDSPYRPLPNSSSFTSYTKSDFNDRDQIELAQVANEVINKGGTFYLSNSDPTQVDQEDQFFDNLYNNYIIKRIEARRAIGAKGNRRGIVKEILVIGTQESGENQNEHDL